MTFSIEGRCRPCHLAVGLAEKADPIGGAFLGQAQFGEKLVQQAPTKHHRSQHLHLGGRSEPEDPTQSRLSENGPALPLEYSDPRVAFLLASEWLTDSN